MPKVTFIDAAGAQRTIEAEIGISLMQAAVDNGVIGILGECGGACQCATCHVYVDAAWESKLPTANESEMAQLDNTFAACLPASRLSCEIIVTAELEGLVVTLPERQV